MQAERVLLSERQHVMHSRGQLAAAQSHVLSLLGGDKKGEKGMETITMTHNLDIAEEPEAELDEDGGDNSPRSRRASDFWDMDWSAVQNSAPAGSADGAPVAEPSS